MSKTDELTIHALRTSLKQYAKPDLGRAVWQIVNTFLPYFALWGLLVYLIKSGASVFLIVPLLVLAALFLVRIFILFHDCAHNSFFASRRANTILGYVAGFLTFTPFAYWQHSHLVHHGSFANLDRRGVGDLWTLTVDEYKALSPWGRMAYRLYRHPLIFLGIGPAYSFLITQRVLPRSEGQRERRSATITNVAILLMVALASWAFGFTTYLLIQLPVVLIAGAVGVWLFYVQHQFEGVYWERDEQWDPVKAALQGSSYYKLPKILQWFTGNIGLHHIHHVLPRIPNYNLQQSYDTTPTMQTAPTLTLKSSLASLKLHLWDESHHKLVSFQSLKA